MIEDMNNGINNAKAAMRDLLDVAYDWKEDKDIRNAILSELEDSYDPKETILAMANSEAETFAGYPHVALWLAAAFLLDEYPVFDGLDLEKLAPQMPNISYDEQSERVGNALVYFVMRKAYMELYEEYVAK